MSKTGTVKFFNRTKNFGFIKEDDGEKEYFFHGTTVKGPLPSDGDTVTFTTEDSDRGPRATNVEKSDGSSAGASQEEPSLVDEVTADEDEDEE